MKFKRVITTISTIALLSLLTGCGSEVVATVNGEKITKEQYERRLKEEKTAYEQRGAVPADLSKQVLDMLINEKIISQLAEEQGITISETDTKEEVKTFIKNLGSEEKFQEFLKKEGMSEKSFYERIKQRKTEDALENKVAKNIKVSEEEALRYFDNNREQFNEPEKVRFRHILIKTEKRTEEQAKKIAQEIINELEKGDDFIKLAKEKSEDPASKDNGGEYEISRGQMAEEIEKIVFSLKPGTITKTPVKTQFGYHVIKTEEKIPAKIRTFDEVKETVIAQLTEQKKQEALFKLFSNFSQKTKVEYKTK